MTNYKLPLFNKVQNSYVSDEPATYSFFEKVVIVMALLYTWSFIVYSKILLIFFAEQLTTFDTNVRILDENA